MGTVNIAVNVFTGALSLFLLIFSAKTGQYQLCYTVSILVIFIGLFSLLIITSEGYRGGMPTFFIFGIVYTVYMLDGRKTVATCSYTGKELRAAMLLLRRVRQAQKALAQLLPAQAETSLM